MTENHCLECGHLIDAHDDDGCWRTESNGDLCPCMLSAGDVALQLLIVKDARIEELEEQNERSRNHLGIQ